MEAKRQDLLERIEVIERMIQEGRQVTQGWGWVSLLWGTGQIVAIVWSLHARKAIVAWLVTMFTCALLTGIVCWFRRRQEVARTTVGRALSAIWTGAIASMFILGFVGGGTGIMSLRAILAMLLCLQGTGSFASGIILRWRLQLAVALLWWIAAPLVMILPWDLSVWVFIGVTAVADVLLGLYLMVFERGQRAIA